ncbi:MAG TPA: hypothetical protein VFS41_10690, partial [Edaphobacter sp.]|nr:hypothetical protein [Edaphobacter sp.]
QQQDQGVSACATTAIWCAVQSIAPRESLPTPAPAEITEAASRYLLIGGRALPSEGLTIQQICEAIRSAGLAPVVHRPAGPDADRAQLLGYIASGFAPIIAIESMQGNGDGHAVCGVGLKLSDVKPQVDPNLHYRDAASAIEGIYVHDDRLGPYASVQLFGHTVQSGVRTGLEIRWPDRTPAELSLLKGLVVPLPIKVRLTVSRMRALGHQLAQVTGLMFPHLSRDIVLHYRYRLGTEYQRMGFEFGLSEKGLLTLVGGSVLSRYIGIVEIETSEGALFDVVLDATETRANPSALLCVCRRASADRALINGLEILADQLGARFVR